MIIIRKLKYFATSDYAGGLDLSYKNSVFATNAREEGVATD